MPLPQCTKTKATDHVTRFRGAFCKSCLTGINWPTLQGRKYICTYMRVCVRTYTRVFFDDFKLRVTARRAALAQRPGAAAPRAAEETP